MGNNTTYQIICSTVLKKSIEQNPHFKEANVHFEKAFLQMFGKNQTETINYFRDCLEYISDMYMAEENKHICYRISSAFFNFIMEASSKGNYGIVGLMYPSANTRAAGINIALQKDVVDRGIIKCDLVSMFCLQRTPNNPKDVTFPFVSDSVKPDEHGNFKFSYVS